VQGYRSRVAEILDPVVTEERSDLDEAKLRVLRLQLAAAKIETEGKLEDANRLVVSVWNEISDDNEPDGNMSDVLCWTLLYVAYITFLLQKYAQYTYDLEDRFKIGLNKRMESVQLRLSEIGDHAAAWDMLHYRLFLLDLTEADNELSNFSKLHSSDLFSAMASLERSKIARAQNWFSEAKCLVQEAKGVFATINLSLRENTAKSEEILQDIYQSKSTGATSENLIAFEMLAETFKKLESPAEESVVLTRLATFYQETGRYSDFARISDKLQGICDAVGSNLEWCQHRFCQLNIFDMQGGQLAATLEGFKSLFSKAERLQIPRLAALCSISICTNYWQQKDWENSLAWGRQALRLSEKQKDTILGSQAAKALALAMRERLKFTKDLSLPDFEELISLLSKWAEIDGKNNNEEDEIDKYGLLSNVEILRATRIDPVNKSDASQKCLDWLQKAEGQVHLLSEEDQIPNLAEIKFKSNEAFYLLDDYSTAIGYVETAKLLFMQAGKHRQANHMQNRIAQLQLLAINQSRLSTELDVGSAQEALNESLRNFQQVQDALLKSDFRLQLAKCHLQQAWIWQNAYELGQPEALQYALEELKATEDIRNGLRADMTIQKDEEVLTHKRTLVAQSADLYELGIKLSLIQKSYGQAWDWAQRGKARAFLDLLGFEGRGTIPSAIIASVNGSSGGKELFDEEMKLLHSCNNALRERRFPIRRKISAIRHQMTSVPELYNLLLYRGAEVLTAQRLPGMFGSLKKVVCVDWALVDNSIWMFTIRPGGQPAAHELTITKAEIASWIESNLRAEYMRQKRANERLRELDPLVAPLANVSKEDELLVFCPSGLLSSLPLHALECEGRLLIDRNPVVYSSSLSVLHHCLLRRSDEIELFDKITIFGNPSCDRTEAEESSKSLGKCFNVEPLIRESATKTVFKNRSDKSSIFHYHGHALFDSVDPLNSALKLHGAASEGSENGDLTARELLTLNLGIALFVMIACESARQEINPGEEPSGLLPMLLLAGVNSTIGTLWKCSDAVGRMFTEVFYHVLKTQVKENLSKNDDVIVVDIARALRQAVLEIRKKRVAPYFWALFVLHGNWQCRFSRKGMNLVLGMEDTEM
jgi:CHAT domain-containing protein